MVHDLDLPKDLGDTKELIRLVIRCVTAKSPARLRAALEHLAKAQWLPEHWENLGIIILGSRLSVLCDVFWEALPEGGISEWNILAARAAYSGDMAVWYGLWKILPAGALTKWDAIAAGAAASGKGQMWRTVLKELPPGAITNWDDILAVVKTRAPNMVSAIETARKRQTN